MIRWRTRIFRSGALSTMSVPFALAPRHPGRVARYGSSRQQRWSERLDDLLGGRRARVEPEDRGSTELLHPAEEAVERSAIARDEAVPRLRLLALLLVSLGALVDAAPQDGIRSVQPDHGGQVPHPTSEHLFAPVLEGPAGGEGLPFRLEANQRVQRPLVEEEDGPGGGPPPSEEETPAAHVDEQLELRPADPRTASDAREEDRHQAGDASSDLKEMRRLPGVDELRPREPGTPSEQACHGGLARPGDAEDLDVPGWREGRQAPADRRSNDPRQGPSDPSK